MFQARVKLFTRNLPLSMSKIFLLSHVMRLFVNKTAYLSLEIMFWLLWQGGETTFEYYHNYSKCEAYFRGYDVALEGRDSCDMCTPATYDPSWVLKGVLTIIKCSRRSKFAS